MVTVLQIVLILLGGVLLTCAMVIFGMVLRMSSQYATKYLEIAASRRLPERGELCHSHRDIVRYAMGLTALLTLSVLGGALILAGAYPRSLTIDNAVLFAKVGAITPVVLLPLSYLYCLITFGFWDRVLKALLRYVTSRAHSKGADRGARDREGDKGDMFR